MTTKTLLSIALLSCIPFVSSFSQDLELQAVAQTGTQFPGATAGEVLTLQEIDCWAQNETGRIVVGPRPKLHHSGPVTPSDCLATSVNCQDVTPTHTPTQPMASAKSVDERIVPKIELGTAGASAGRSGTEQPQT